MSETLPSTKDNINIEHRSFKGLEGRISQPKEVVFGAPSPDLSQSVVRAMQIFPEQMRVDSLRDRVPTFHAAVVEPKPDSRTEQGESEKRSKSGIFFLSGAPGSAGEHAYFAAEMLKAAEAHPELGNFEIASVIGSAISKDTEGSPFVSGTPERAAYLAAFIYEMVEKKGLDQVYLIGHSMGGLELPYLAPLLKKLFELKQQKTEIGGMIMHQPGGMDNRDLKESAAFLTSKTMRMVSLRDEATYMFPTAKEFGDMEIKIGQAKDKGDFTLAASLERVLSEMREQPKRNEEYLNTYLDDKQKARLRSLDDVIALKGEMSGVSASQWQKVYEQRLGILQPVVKKILEARGKDNRDPSPLAFVNLVPMIGPNRGITGMTPLEIRALSDFPVAVTASNADAYFSTDEVMGGIDQAQMEDFESMRKDKAGDKEEIYRKTRLFPNAPATFLADIPNLPHIGTTVDPNRVMPIMMDMLSRMKESSIKDEKKITRLNYSGKFNPPRV